MSVKEKDTGKEIRHLEFTPTSDCLRLFKNHKILFRPLASGFETYYRLSESSVGAIQSPIDSRQRFSFAISVKDPAFFRLYDVEGDSQPQFYLDNLTNSGLVSTAVAGHLTKGNVFEDEDLTKVYSTSFSVLTDMTVLDPPAEWRIKKKFTPNDTLQTVPIVNSDGLDMVDVDINDPIKHEAEFISEDGPFLLETNKPNPPVANIYLSRELGRKSINGVLDIYWETAQNDVPDEIGRKYQITFNRK